MPTLGRIKRGKPTGGRGKENGHRASSSAGFKDGSYKRAKTVSSSKWGRRSDILPKPYVPVGDEEAAGVPASAAPSVEANFPRRATAANRESSHHREVSRRQRLLAPSKAAYFEATVASAGGDEAPWLAYVAWHVHEADISAAREVLEKALRQFSWSSDDKKLALWLAYVNLEIHFGNSLVVTPLPDNYSLQHWGDTQLAGAATTSSTSDRGALLQRALKANDPVKVFEHIADQFGRLEAKTASLLAVRQLIKLAPDSLDAMKLAVNLFVQFGEKDAVKDLLSKSRASLSAQEQRLLRVAQARSEFVHGEPLRGWHAFESLLESFPKRSDLWIAFAQSAAAHVDKLGQAKVRSLFDQLVQMDWLKAKHGKVIFHEWLRFEKAQGGAHWNEVKAKLVAFVNKLQES